MYKHILVAVDGSDTSNLALQEAIKLAKEQQASLRLVHVFDAPHHYHFRLLALSVEHLAQGKNRSCRDVAREANEHVLAEANLIGIYER